MEIVCHPSTKNQMFKDPALVGKVFDARLYQFIQESTLYAEREIKTIIAAEAQGVMGAQGGLLGSTYSEMRGTPASPIGVVSSPSAYAIVIEEGRRPGQRMPPSDMLVPWIMQKFDLPEEQAQKLAFVVARSIGRKGFAGVHMYARGMKLTEAYMQKGARELGLYVASDLEKEV